ncbi:MAG TPA: fused MFS/spermidine synthase [Pirellulales bacterium]|nr:fused MFS/spermidine synthase [Pirellulales bacterium]
MPLAVLSARRLTRLVAAGVVLAVAAWLCQLAEARVFGLGPYDGHLEADLVSKFSHIRVRRDGDVRVLLFVRDSGEEVVETYLNLERPHELITEYTRAMFVSYLYAPRPKKVLLIGLGGGAMVHFLRHSDPDVSIDVVEIDSAIVDLAKKYFLVREDERTKIIVADAVKFLTGSPPRYDVVYMDAFLKPTRQTDSTGVPLRLKTEALQREILRKALVPDGVAVYNLNAHPKVADDVASIAAVFRQAYVYQLGAASGYVVAATAQAKRDTQEALIERASDIDRRFQASFALESIARQLLPPARRTRGR